MAIESACFGLAITAAKVVLENGEGGWLATLERTPVDIKLDRYVNCIVLISFEITRELSEEELGEPTCTIVVVVVCVGVGGAGGGLGRVLYE